MHGAAAEPAAAAGVGRADGADAATPVVVVPLWSSAVWRASRSADAALGRLRLELGVLARSRPLAMAGSGGRAGDVSDATGGVIGLSTPIGDGGRRFWQLPLQRRAPRLDMPGLASAAVDEGGRARVGLVFRRSDALADIRRGSLMKMQINSQTTLSLRPHGGRVAIQLSSQW